MSLPAILPEFKTDHFKFYHVQIDRKPLQVPFSLWGQFEEKDELPPRPHAVGPLNHLGNPVSKNYRPIQNHRTHLTWYPLAGEDEPQRTVFIENQFGKDTFVLGNPELLLVPALKSERDDEPKPPALPDDVSHFKGYKILQQKPFKHGDVFLKDQFDPEFEQPSLFKLKAPEYFCVPVAKFVKRHEWPAVNLTEHLTIYPITQHPRDKRRRVWDQFDGGILQVIKSMFLAVPTIKTGVKRGVTVAEG